LIDIRLRTRISDEELEQKKGKLLTEQDFNVLLTGSTTVRKPDGKLLLIYMRGILGEELLDKSYETLHLLKDHKSENRGLASGMKRAANRPGVRTYTKPIASTIVGSFDPAGPKQYCRLTAWSGRETEKFQSLWPLFQTMSGIFKERVPDRFAAQEQFAKQTHSEWVIPGTVFTTITINNSYPTGVHTDKGDLDEGFSNLAVLRKGEFTGGRLTFPRFRIAVDMQHGDMILMDAHEWHGNTSMFCACGDPMASRPCAKCGAERISVVAYYRTKMKACGSLEEEQERQRQYAERKNTLHREAGDPYEEADMEEATLST
jgi:hypothetical protein